jgi:8-oxo-dGTP pyrophosphatase MutT (NUDIX family)
MRTFPKSMDELCRFYPPYSETIRAGVWYAERYPFYARSDPPVDQWSLLKKSPPLGAESRVPYWQPEPEGLRREMREFVHLQQRKGDISSASAARGTARSRDEFARFPVGYNYDERCNNPKERSAAVLGGALVEDSVRLFEFDVKRREATVELANYLDQRATNMNPDIAFSGMPIALEQARTFRQLDSIAGHLRPLHQCYQANTIGVACILVGRDGTPVLVLRSKDTAVMNDGSSWHCSSSGALMWDDVSGSSCDGGTRLIEGLTRGMARELKEELELLPAEYELTLTDFARELPRAGKPQFFFLARSTDSASSLVGEIASRTKRAVSEQKDVGAWERNRKPPSPISVFYNPELPQEGVAADPNLRLDVVADQMIDFSSRRFTYEGYAALVFAAHYWRASNLG